MREMKKKVIVAVFVLMFSMLSTHLTINSTMTDSTVSSSSPTPTLSVQSVTVPVCTNVIINIMATDFENIIEFTIFLRYNNTLLKFLDADKGSFWNGGFEHFPPTINGTLSDLQMKGYPPTPSRPVNGNGTLVTIIFHCIDAGPCDLVLHDTVLGNSTGEKINPINQNGKCTQATTLTGPLYINENYTLCTNLNCNGEDFFIINASNIVFDLNGQSLRCLSQKGIGIKVYGSSTHPLSNICIKNGRIIGFQKGLSLYYCNDVNITHVAVRDSIVNSVEIRNSYNIQIVGENEFSNAFAESVYLDTSGLVNITGNRISGSSNGIEIVSSNNINVSRNEISDNKAYGIRLDNSEHNFIWNNDFLRSGKLHVQILGGLENNLNLSYPYGGNYWDDYRSQSIDDKFSGENHTLPGPDGIGDKPYVIGNNRDNYPLMDEYGSKFQVFDVHVVRRWSPKKNDTIILPVAVYTDSHVEGFNFRNSTNGQNRPVGLMSFSVSIGTFCKVIVSKKLLDGAFEIEVDETPAPTFMNWDGDYVFANFNYTSERSHQVRVCGEVVRQYDLNGDGAVDIIDIALIAKKELGSEYVYENPLG